MSGRFEQRNCIYANTPIATRRWKKDGFVHYAIWDAWRTTQLECHDEAVREAQREISQTRSMARKGR